MKQYNANNIKNIAIVGHGGSGKTTLAEALLYTTGATDRLGTIADGTTVCDFDPEETKRKASIGLSVAPFEYKDCKVNLLDAPGLFDFVGGMSEAIRAADSVIVTVSGKSGLTTGSKKAYKMAKKQGKARMIYVGKLDRESADFYKVLEQLKTEFGPSICPLVVPYVEDHKVQCYIDLIDMKAFRYEKGKAVEVDVPQSEHRIDGLITAISEAVAETDDDLFEKYFSGENSPTTNCCAESARGFGWVISRLCSAAPPLRWKPLTCSSRGFSFCCQPRRRLRLKPHRMGMEKTSPFPVTRIRIWLRLSLKQ